MPGYGGYGGGGGWSGPDREYRGIGQFDPIGEAMRSMQAARANEPQGGGGGGRPIQVTQAPDDQQESEWAMAAAKDPNIIGPGQQRLDPDATPEQAMRFATQPRSFQVGGRPYQIDPRMSLGLELAREKQARGVQVEGEVAQSNIRQQADEARVRRLVAAGYKESEATRQVFGGPRTVAEEQEIINTRSADQLARDKMIQGEISARGEAARTARANLSTLLERSRSGDRNASRQLRAQQMLFQDATRAQQDALKSRTANALGGLDMGAPGMDPADAQLEAAVNAHLDDVQSMSAAQHGAVAGIAKAATTGAPGADGVSDADAAAFLGVRAPQPLNDGSSPVAGDPMAKYHRAFKRGALPGQAGPGRGLKPAPKPLEDHMTGPASTDPGYRTWLMSKGYDVSKVAAPSGTSAPPDDEEQEF